MMGYLPDKECTNDVQSGVEQIIYYRWYLGRYKLAILSRKNFSTLADNDFEISLLKVSSCNARVCMKSS